MQTILTVCSVLAASIYLLRRTWRSAQSNSQQAACGQCSMSKDGARRKPLITLEIDSKS